MRCEHDGIVLGPTGAAIVWSLTHRHRCPAVEGDSLEPVIREEPEPLAIRREERILRVLVPLSSVISASAINRVAIRCWPSAPRARNTTLFCIRRERCSRS